MAVSGVREASPSDRLTGLDICDAHPDRFPTLKKYLHGGLVSEGNHRGRSVLRTRDLKPDLRVGWHAVEREAPQGVRRPPLDRILPVPKWGMESNGDGRYRHSGLGVEHDSFDSSCQGNLNLQGLGAGKVRENYIDFGRVEPCRPGSHAGIGLWQF
jgi:hypothetical protein